MKISITIHSETTTATPDNTAAVSDFADYAPLGNVASFVGADVYAKGLVRLGRVDIGSHVR